MTSLFNSKNVYITRNDVDPYEKPNQTQMTFEEKVEHLVAWRVRTTGQTWEQAWSEVFAIARPHVPTIDHIEVKADDSGYWDNLDDGDWK